MYKKVIDIFTNPEPDPPEEKSPEEEKIIEETPAAENIEVEAEEPPRIITPERKVVKKSPALKVFFSLLGIIVVFYSFRLFYLKSFVSSSAENIKNRMESAAFSLKELDFGGAQKSLIEAKNQIGIVNETVNNEGFFKVSFRAVPGLFTSLFDLGKTTVNLATNANYLAQNSFDFIVNNQGEKLIEEIRKIKKDLQDISGIGNDLKQKSSELGINPEQGASLIDAQIFGANQFLSSFLSWISREKENNVLILFQNISEMRPGGGFVGSYAIATLERANLRNLEVRDIYDPDGQLKISVIPPEPLQSITSDWGARDANWFFDFPLSARKIIYFLEESAIYKEKNKKFDAVISINTNVIADLLTVTGPITLLEYDRTITNGNVLDSLQEEVRSGDDREVGEPKRIIKVLAPILIEKLADLDDAGKKEIFKIIGHHIDRKNIMVYFKDLVIQSYLKSLGATGSIAELPDNFEGDYLAVINANIASGKTDAVINQTIQLESIIDLGGEIYNNLKIIRSHNGDKRDEWWYRSVNKNYIQVLTPPGSTITSITGGDKVNIKPSANYNSGKYITDYDLKSLENSSIVFGKSVFDTWLLTDSGKTSTLELKYKNPYSIDLNEEKNSYRFMFDKQSGVIGGLEFKIKAPAGYVWESTGTRNFNYSNFDLSSRTELNLNLIKES